jgi:alpha-beta hydrolase superfamily lysophospholipase
MVRRHRRAFATGLAAQGFRAAMFDWRGLCRPSRSEGRYTPFSESASIGK